ncbi:MAG: hypothetical protein U0869_00890 [Chloroflexota bacterium]
MLRRLFLFAFSFALSVAASLVATYLVVLRPMRRTWGIDPEESGRSLPGDGLVPEAGLVETRGITIDAPPSAVWPWLVQMGYGRGGWYSYDQMDNNAASADRILADYQSLVAGDVVPTWPGGGFQVAEVDAGRSLVLYLDTAIVKAQQAAAEGAVPEETTKGLKAAGAMGDLAMPEFKASWTFHLEPVDAARTRVIERMRAWAPDASPAQRLALPAFGMGVFLMTRKQLLGLKARVERYGAGGAEPVMPPAPEPAPVEDVDAGLAAGSVPA